MEISFITGNENKFAEARKIIPSLRRIEMDLPEIQELDARKIIREKLREAGKSFREAMVVEDTSLELKCLNGLPGPFIRWFQEKLGNQGLFEIASKSGLFDAKAVLWLGFMDPQRKIRFFNSTLNGKIVSPKGTLGFGWDPIFKPQGHLCTLAEMTLRQKNEISMRAKAFNKLKEFLATST